VTEALSSDQKHADAVAKVGKMIAANKICMLTTRGEDGEMLARPMAVVEREFDGTLWFVSHDDSRKTRQIGREPLVNVTYASGSEWISIKGRAEIVRDVAKLKEVWDAGVEAWFPEGPEDPKTVLVKVSAEGAEYWDSPGGSLVSSAISFVKSKATGKPYQVENERVDM
jgi:general stress protein 26